MPDGVRVDLNHAAIRDLLGSPDGPVGRVLSEAAVKVTAGAKRRCPVRTGRLRGSIDWDLDTAGGLHADIGTDVSYALAVEFPTKPHVIRSHGNYPLRSGDKTFGRVVHHPGTRGQSFLRSALDDIRGL